MSEDREQTLREIAQRRFSITLEYRYLEQLRGALEEAYNAGARAALANATANTQALNPEE